MKNTLFLAASMSMLVILSSCGDKSSGNSKNKLSQNPQNPVTEDQDQNQQQQQQQQNQSGSGHASAGGLGPFKGQIERLARPAINEGLIITNAFLNAFNSIPPSADLSAAAQPVLAEAAVVIEAFDQLDGKDDLTVGDVVTAFLPDVMRIDTRVSIPAGTTAYNADVSGDKGILTGGRKIEDDVIDITLSFLVAGDASGMSVKDNVSYAGAPGNPSQGHKKLHGQANYGGTATFPFLAEAY